MSDSKLIPHSTIAEIVALRDMAVERFESAFEKLDEANLALGVARGYMRDACRGTNPAIHDPDRAREIQRFEDTLALPDAEEWLRTARRIVDTKVWLALIEMTDLETLMDKEAKDELRTQLAWIPESVSPKDGRVINAEEIAKGVPPVDEETIEATIRSFAEESPTIFARGLANAFSKLERRFKSHDGFAIGSRMILTRAFDEYGWWNYHSHHRETLLDVERVFLVLDGKPVGAAYGGIAGRIDHARKDAKEKPPFVVEGDYFRVRVFKNGNAHLWFTRDDLVEKANLILAEYYGETIGTGKDVDEPYDFSTNKSVTQANLFGFYPTPDTLADFVVAHLGLNPSPVLERIRVLEPSAGTGQLSRRIAETLGRHGLVDVVEIQHALAKPLKDSGLYRTVFTQDFLELRWRAVEPYDAIAMNPPFDLQRDIDHVTHAWGFLKPGGTLVAVMSAGTEFRTNRKAKAFRKLVEENRGQWYDNPPGSFSSVGTNVNTRTLVVQKRR